jgi:hypothetical protein
MVSSVQHPLEPPQVCVLRHSRAPPQIHRFQSNITVDPLKVQAIIEIPPPQNLCQLQSLQGKTNFLWRFVPEYSTRTHSFLRLLCHDIPFHWDKHAQKSFDDIKMVLSNAPLISSTDYNCDYILYISASTISVAGVLIQINEHDHENFIYYISKNLSGLAMKYKHEEKLALTFVLAVQKLHHYILLHTTKVVVDSNPIVIHNFGHRDDGMIML